MNNYSIGDGMVALALAGGVVGYFHLAYRTRQKRLEILHQERMAAMDKGIPLPELPLEPSEARRESDPDRVLPILGTVLASLSIGAMIALYLNLEAGSRFWVAPLPFAFLGAGLIIFHLLRTRPER